MTDTKPDPSRLTKDGLEGLIIAYSMPQHVADLARDLLDAKEAAERENEKLRKSLTSLVELNEDHSPFGGEMYQDRIERAWYAARTALTKEAAHG